MLTCISCPKQFGRGRAPFYDSDDDDAVNEISPQIKDMTSGATEHGRRRHHQGSRFTKSEGVLTPRTAAAKWREMEARMRWLSIGERTPSVSGRTEASSAFLEDGEDEEPKEWVSQVEPGILITFLSLPQGGNYVRKIRFSQDMFDQYRAQKWWEENYEDVMELYNVQRFNNQAMPLPTPPRFEDEVKKGCALECSSSDSLEQHKSCRGHYNSHQHSHCYDSSILTTTPKLSSTSGSKTETSSTDASTRASSSPEELDQSEEIFSSVNNASDMEREWVEEDVPGVYITIRELPRGIRELCRVRFSREKFGEMHARLWWEENRARIRQQYLR
ncbi:protein Brevis radix-like 1 [Zingiber officinale]|uniref:protein Brevis radix-like 1 n=1 Tax=Zingiber officinale TaxID=94328 RepID=UPI001C4CFABB|nr:protein Brevis radix-like 1 [Zingiber officinale]